MRRGLRLSSNRYFLFRAHHLRLLRLRQLLSGAAAWHGLLQSERIRTPIPLMLLLLSGLAILLRHSELLQLGEHL